MVGKALCRLMLPSHHDAFWTLNAAFCAVQMRNHVCFIALHHNWKQHFAGLCKAMSI
jgi:hypothetical protein